MPRRSEPKCKKKAVSTRRRRTSNCHNTVVNENTHMAYVVGNKGCRGGLYKVDVSDPGNTQHSGCFDADDYTHDTHGQAVAKILFDDAFSNTKGSITDGEMPKGEHAPQGAARKEDAQTTFHPKHASRLSRRWTAQLMPTWSSSTRCRETPRNARMRRTRGLRKARRPSTRAIA